MTEHRKVRETAGGRRLSVLEEAGMDSKMADLFGPRSSAIFSPDRRYRYTLERTVGDSDTTLMVIGLNPSTADETTDDPTIRRCIGFARSWGAGRLVMTNLFAYRATEPRDMLVAADPVGPDNDVRLCDVALTADLILAAWGVNGGFMNRNSYVTLMLGARPMACLGLTQGGHPRHPLYVPAVTKPIPFGLSARRWVPR